MAVPASRSVAALAGPRPPGLLAPCIERAGPRRAAKRAILRRHPAAAAAAANGGTAASPPPTPANDSSPADERALLLEALDSGSDEEVSARLEELQQRWPANPHFVVARARLAAKAGDAAAARALFERAAEVAAAAEPRDGSIALHAWANFEAGQGREKAAAALAQRAVEADPKHAVPHSLLGKLAEASGQLAAAEQHYEAALAAEPRHAPSLQALALLAARQGRANAARAAFQRAIEACPENAPLYQVAERVGQARTTCFQLMDWLGRLPADGGMLSCLSAASHNGAPHCGAAGHCNHSAHPAPQVSFSPCRPAPRRLRCLSGSGWATMELLRSCSEKGRRRACPTPRCWLPMQSEWLAKGSSPLLLLLLLLLRGAYCCCCCCRCCVVPTVPALLLHALVHGSLRHVQELEC